MTSTECSLTSTHRSNGNRLRVCRTAACRGIDEVRHNIFDPLDRDWWNEFTAHPEEFLDAGDQVVVLGRYQGIAKQSGLPLDVPFVHVWTVREGRVTRFRQFLDTAGWNAALGT